MFIKHIVLIFLCTFKFLAGTFNFLAAQNMNITTEISHNIVVNISTHDRIDTEDHKPVNISIEDKIDTVDHKPELFERTLSCL